MKNNKSPGTEFKKKVFWKQLGYFVVRSLNDGFNKSKLLATQKEGLTVCIPKGDKPKEYIKILSATQNEGLIVCIPKGINQRNT